MYITVYGGACSRTIGSTAGRYARYTDAAYPSGMFCSNKGLARCSSGKCWPWCSESYCCLSITGASEHVADDNDDNDRGAASHGVVYRMTPTYKTKNSY